MDLAISGDGLIFWQILGFLIFGGVIYAGIKLYIVIYRYFKNRQ